MSEKNYYKKMPTWVHSAIKEHIIDGLTYEQIGAKHNRTVATVWRYFNGDNVQALIKEMKDEAIANISEELKDLQLLAVHKMKEIISKPGTSNTQRQAAADILKGTRILSEKTTVENTGDPIIQIIPPVKE